MCLKVCLKTLSFVLMRIENMLGGGGDIVVMRQTKACTLSISQKSFCKTVTKLVIKVKR